MMDYQKIAVDRLTGQFAGSPKLRSLVEAMVSPLADAELVADALTAERWIDSAVGAQLDGCGQIVVESRMGRDDEEYRRALKFRVFVNVSNGTPIDLMRGLAYLTQPDDAQYIEQYPATVMLYTDGPDVDADISVTMQDIAPAGISDVPVMVSYTATPFRLAKSPVPDELWVSSGSLDVAGSDLQVSSVAVVPGDYSLGGIVPAELSVGDDLYLDVDSGTLGLYCSSFLTTLGKSHLTGVFQ